MCRLSLALSAQFHLRCPASSDNHACWRLRHSSPTQMTNRLSGAAFLPKLHTIFQTFSHFSRYFCSIGEQTISNLYWHLPTVLDEWTAFQHTVDSLPAKEEYKVCTASNPINSACYMTETGILDIVEEASLQKPESPAGCLIFSPYL